jgi:hypothetical protein
MDAAANWAEPANVVADMTVAASVSMPAVRARTPNERTMTPIGAIARAPSRYRFTPPGPSRG